jgi:hypothetical protein
MGTRELIVFHPDYQRDDRWARFLVFRRDEHGRFDGVATNDDRVRSEVLGCYVVAVGEGLDCRLRLGLDPDGSVLFPTEAEALRAEADAARTEADAARTEADAARTKAEAAEAELDRLRALLEQKK